MPQADWLIHLGNLFFLASYSVRGILWLRLLAVLGGVCVWPYYFLQSTPLWEPLLWSVSFVAINAFHVVWLLLERRPVRLSPDEEALYRLVFAPYSKRKFLKLLRRGDWQEFDTDTRVIERGGPITHLFVNTSGELKVVRNGETLLEVEPGFVIGAEGFHGLVPQVDVVASPGTRGFQITLEAVREAAKRDPDLALILDRLAQVDMVRKIQMMGQRMLAMQAAQSLPGASG